MQIQKYRDEINKLDFDVLFTKLCLSKNKELNKQVINVYWEDLNNLIHLEETLIYARQINFAHWFPSVADLIALNKKINDKIKTLNMIELFKEKNNI